MIRIQAKRNPDAIAILAPGRDPLTYAALDRQIRQSAATLRSLGIQANDRVAVMLPDGPELAVAVLGIASAATCAPLNPAHREREVEREFASLGCRALVAPHGSVSPAATVARAHGIRVLDPDALLHGSAVEDFPAPQSGDAALALHTSGTEGCPKLVLLTHANLWTSAGNICDALELTPRDRCLSVMPLFHIHGLSAIFASLAAGASVVCPPGFADPDFFDRFFEWLDGFQPTWYTAAPTIHQAILAKAPQYPEVVKRSSLRFLRSASAPMPREPMLEIERVFRVPFLEAYGMTEAAPQIASNRLPPAERKPGSVGQPAGPEVTILETGEIAIRGANVSGGGEDGWLRTGDLGRMDADGHLFVTGRIREIINRGGEKISPREVDEVLLQHPAVAQAVTFGVPHATLGEGVAAAVVLRPETSATEAGLRQFVASRLAAFKAPQSIAIVDEIPAGSTGKLQRGSMAARMAPATPIEQKVAAIWADVLGGERPGRHDDFFRRGGHSLSAMQVIARLRHQFGVELAPEDLFAASTVAALAARVEMWGRPPGLQPTSTSASAKSVLSCNSGTWRSRADLEVCPTLSFAQDRLWFLDRLQPGNAAYNVACPLRLTGPLDLPRLEAALYAIRQRHESLRTVFALEGERPVQRILPAAASRLPIVDVEDDAAAMRLAKADAELPFDLATGPLFRATLLRLGAEDHVLLLTAHHIVFDGWSAGVLHRELQALYAGAPLAELPIQYREFARWQRAEMQGEALERQLGYWKQQLANLPRALELPASRPRPAMQTFRGGSISSRIPPSVTERLREVGLRDGATLFMTVMAAFQILLHRYSGQEDLPIGVVIANRTRVETEPLIGFFANTLVFRGDLSGNPTFRELLGRVQASAWAAYAHQDLPFEKLVEQLRPERDPGRTPLFQVMLAFQNVPDGAETSFLLAPGLAARTFKPQSETAKFDLTLYVWDTPQGLLTKWQYNADLFAENAIERMARDFEALAGEIAADPDTAAHAACFHELFEHHAAQTPDAPALEFEGQRLTYRDLNGRANQLAHRLRNLGVGPGQVAGIDLPRSAEMLVAILGVLKAGAAYVTLDPDYPEERLAFIRNDAGVRVVVSRSMLANGGTAGTHNLQSGAAPSNLAYIMYTSGSVGSPKGVMISHANLSHCARAMCDATGITPADRYLHTASFCFSSSVRQFAVPLGCGAAVIIASTGEVRDPRRLLDLVRRRRVSVMDIVPSLWRSCTQEMLREPTRLDALRLILSASERLPADLPREWRAAAGDRVRLVNMYGQTETTGIVTVYPLPQGETAQDSVPVGHPIANTRIYLRDGNEVYVAGDGVAAGYLNQPELTAERFSEDPAGGGRLYRTGDLARYREDGSLEFLGRADDQIKIRGFRIEPGEIEATLARHPRVQECAVVMQAEGDVSRLAAFVVPREQPATETLMAELRAWARRTLPEYMVPAAMVGVDALPLSLNGKVDRRQLAVTRLAAQHTPAKSAVEKSLAKIWGDLLRLERVSVTDNFFDLGGDSLLSVAMVHRANDAGVPVTLQQLFQHQTIAELAQAVAAVAPRPADAAIRVTLESLRAWGCEALERAGLTAEGARIVTEVQIEASLRGQRTHNVDSIPRYARRLLAGAMNPRPQIRIERETRISAQMDGDNGPGQWVATVAIEVAIRKARESGIGVVTVRRSNHFGAAGHYVWQAAQQGLIGLCTTNGPVILAPTGGVTASLGNNPIGAAIPAGRYHPILLDIAMSVSPRGKIGLQLAEGKPLPPGWILDRYGRPSTDPADLAASLGVPIGGHKGYGLALVMEALSGALPGAGFCLDHGREQMRQTAEPRDIGHFFLVIDPALFSPLEEFTGRVERMIDQVKSGERAEGVEEILIPGEAELRAREENLRRGVPLGPVTWRTLRKYAEEAGLGADLVMA